MIVHTGIGRTDIFVIAIVIHIASRTRRNRVELAQAVILAVIVGARFPIIAGIYVETAALVAGIVRAGFTVVTQRLALAGTGDAYVARATYLTIVTGIAVVFVGTEA